MKYNAHLLMQGSPELKVNAKTSPIAFRTSAKGALDCQVGKISVNVGEIPLRIAVPFLKGRDRPPLIASLGGFNVTLNPFRIQIENIAVALDGVLGEEGINSSLDCKVACKTSMDVVGTISGKVAGAAFELEEEHPDDVKDGCTNKG